MTLYLHFDGCKGCFQGQQVDIGSISEDVWYGGPVSQHLTQGPAAAHLGKQQWWSRSWDPVIPAWDPVSLCWPGLAWPGSCYGEHLDSESLCLSLSAFQINLQNLKISQQSHIIVLRVCFCGIVKTRIMVCHKLWWMCGQLPSEATASASWLTQNCWTSHFCRSGGWDIVIHWSLACHFWLSAKMDMFSDGSTSVFYKLNVHILMISLLSFSYDLHKSFFH